MVFPASPFPSPRPAPPRPASRPCEREGVRRLRHSLGCFSTLVPWAEKAPTPLHPLSLRPPDPSSWYSGLCPCLPGTVFSLSLPHPLSDSPACLLPVLLTSALFLSLFPSLPFSHPPLSLLKSWFSFSGSRSLRRVCSATDVCVGVSTLMFVLIARWFTLNDDARCVDLLIPQVHVKA